jgi:hypothetical protein
MNPETAKAFVDEFLTYLESKTANPLIKLAIASVDHFADGVIDEFLTSPAGKKFVTE